MGNGRGDGALGGCPTTSKSLCPKPFAATFWAFSGVSTFGVPCWWGLGRLLGLFLAIPLTGTVVSILGIPEMGSATEEAE
jgi:hypothetical protein